MFFTGYEDEFISKSYTPQVSTMTELVHQLSSSRMYIGCDNLISDIAAALHIPSIILHPYTKSINREMFSTRNDEFISYHIYFSNGVRWDHEKIRKGIDFVESRFMQFSRPVKEYDRIKSILSGD